MTLNGSPGQFIRAHAGLVAAVALLAAGGMGALWISGLLALPAVVAENTAQDKVVAGAATDNERRIRIVEQRQKWIICTTIPPNTRRELSALRVDCSDVEVLMQNMGNNEP